MQVVFIPDGLHRTVGCSLPVWVTDFAKKETVGCAAYISLTGVVADFAADQMPFRTCSGSCALRRVTTTALAVMNPPCTHDR